MQTSSWRGLFVLVVLAPEGHKALPTKTRPTSNLCSVIMAAILGQQMVNKHFLSAGPLIGIFSKLCPITSSKCF